MGCLILYLVSRGRKSLGPRILLVFTSLTNTPTGSADEATLPRQHEGMGNEPDCV